MAFYKKIMNAFLLSFYLLNGAKCLAHNKIIYYYYGKKMDLYSMWLCSRG